MELKIIGILVVVLGIGIILFAIYRHKKYQIEVFKQSYIDTIKKFCTNREISYLSIGVTGIRFEKSKELLHVIITCKNPRRLIGYKGRIVRNLANYFKGQFGIMIKISIIDFYKHNISDL